MKLKTLLKICGKQTASTDPTQISLVWFGSNFILKLNLLFYELFSPANYFMRLDSTMLNSYRWGSNKNSGRGIS